MKSAGRAAVIRRHKPGLTVAAAVAVAIAPLFVSFEASAQAASEPADELTEVVISGDRLNIMQTTPVESVFGFGKSVLETPRSVTTINNELLSKTLITELDDLVALAPGSFTQSFFGVAGSLDVRGTPGENYFRGMKRIDNPGNYPTAIGASDHLDIVRGPASPIYGPSKIGGYLNFVPKSARAGTGKYISEPTGEVGLTYGSYDKRVLHGEVGGPSSLMGRDFGYYLYGESENSGSYYENTSTQQTILQASLDMRLSDVWRTEFGGMYQNFKGNQVAGWNRLTQNLIDNGTYITGSPRSLDVNGNGLLDIEETFTTNIAIGYFAPPGIPTSQATIAAAVAANPNMRLLNPGTAHIEGSKVLVQEDDNLSDDVLTLYFDMIGEYSDNFKLQNKVFFEQLQNNNENAYGFSQFVNTWVAEDQFIVSYSTQLGDSTAVNMQLSPQIRHQDFEHGDDFFFEYFDRRDITKPGSPIDRRALATRGQAPYSNHTIGNFTNYGIAALIDVTFAEKLNFVGGARYDYVDMKSETQPDQLDPTIRAADTDSGTSWSGSLSYQLPYGLRPYVTIARQNTIVLGQGGQIEPLNIINGTAIAASSLDEYGIKSSLLEGHLFAAIDYFKQKRLDVNSQDVVTNNTTLAKGVEFELRYVINPVVTVTGAYTHLTIQNLTATQRGGQFTFLGADDLKSINPTLFLGGVISGILPTTGAVYKAGIPEDLGSLNFLLGLDGIKKGLSATVGATYVSSTPSGLTQVVTLPSYTLVNAGVRYEASGFNIGFQIKNLTDERYFRSNFPDLFGSSVVLPEVPRTYLVTAAYRF